MTLELEEILNLQAEDLVARKRLFSIACEAEHATMLVQKKCAELFGDNPMLQKVPVFCDREDQSREYLTREGVWQARYVGQSYDIKCDLEEIFKYFLSEYLVSNDLLKQFSHNSSELYLKAFVCSRYFRKFLRDIA